MSQIKSRPKRNTVQSVFLILGYVCVLCCATASLTRLGWIHPEVPGFYGFRAIWGWLIATAICLGFAWYLGRRSRN